MSKKSVTTEAPVPEDEFIPTVHFSFNKKQKLPDGFKSMTLGDTVKVVVKGKIKSVSQDEYSSSFSIEMGNVKLAFPEAKASSISEAMEDTKRGRVL